MKDCPCAELKRANRDIENLNTELEQLLKYKRETQKLLRTKEKDLVLLARRCAALSETLKAAVKEKK